MNIKTKIAIAVITAAVVGVLLFWIQKQNNELAELKSKNGKLIEQLELGDGTTRNMSSYASKKDIERIIDDARMDFRLIKKDLNKLDSDLQGVQRLVVTSQGFKGADISSSTTTKGVNEDGSDVKPPAVECKDGSTVACPDVFGHLTQRQVIKLQEPFGNKSVPVGDVGFSSWKPKPWDVTLYPRKYQVTNVVSVSDDGKTNMHSQIIISSNGEDVVVPIDKASYIEKYPDAKFGFNPRLYFGVGAGFVPYNITSVRPDVVAEVMPGANVFVFSYGKTKMDINWAILGLGLGYATQNKSLGFLLSPVYYNIGKPIPLMENLFLGPTVSLDTSGNLGVLLGLSVGL